MRYCSEVDVKRAIGIPDWRHLRKEHFLQLLSMDPQMDTEVALNVIGQIPEIAKLARAAIDDVEKAFDAATASNDRSMEMVHEVEMERLALLRAELGRDDLSPEYRLRVIREVRDVHERSLAKDTENKRFVSEQLEGRLWGAFVGAATIAIAVVGVARSGTKRPAMGRLF